jgi:tetratricopeptide (TPR) repeat protein
MFQLLISEIRLKWKANPKAKASVMLPFRFALIFLIFASINPLVSAQDSASPAPVQGLGKVSFPISCKAEVRPTFEKGVALLHSFQYAAAEKDFNVVAQGDPQCAIAYWGLAMTAYHALWDGADEKAVRKGNEYLVKARKIGAQDKREQEYIGALSIILSGDRAASAGQLAGYSHALEQLCQHYPEDGEAQAFYALSLLALREKGDDLQVRKQAIAILKRLSAAQPEHPGAVHYLIHAADTPELALQGLDAARRYAKIAPDSSHALHMPSHIFVRLGLWQESIDSNQAAAVAAADATEHQLGEAHYQFHAMDYLDYSYLQLGEEGKARQVVEDLNKVPGRDLETITNLRMNFTTRNMMELHRWKEALALAPEGDARNQQMILLLRTVAAARTGDAHAAGENLKRLKAFKDKRRDKRLEDYCRHVAEAWVDYVNGKHDKALKKMRSVADKQDQEDAGGFGVPAREMLADMLLELHQSAAALAEYEAVLKLVPNRFNALYGAAAAAEMAGDAGKAKSYYSKLRENCPPQADREELQKARIAAAGSN